MSPRKRIYLDHAATSWPKSDAVLHAMDQFARSCGASVGRGGYQSAWEASEVVTQVRRKLAAMIGASSSNDISLHSSGTLALNTAIFGLLRPGDHVITTACDHNSVLRPLASRQQEGMIQWDVIDCDSSGLIDVEQLILALRPNTRLVAVTHASNVTGQVQPIESIGQHLLNHSAAFLVDAAQTFGAIALNARSIGFDLLAAPGHKSVGGPSGTGFLYVNSDWHDQMRPFVLGGTGSTSESLEMPVQMPTKLEAGTLNAPALAGLSVALDEVEERFQALRQTESHHIAEIRHPHVVRIHEQLSIIPQVRVIGGPGPLPVFSFLIDGYSPSDVAAILDVEFGIEVRSGYLCAAKIHACLGTSSDGVVRASLGHQTRDDEIDQFIAAIQAIASSITSE